MGTPDSVSTVVVVATLFAVFVIVLVFSHKAFKQTPFFGDAGGGVIAVCVALLSILGLVRLFGFPVSGASTRGEPRETGGLVDFVLLPYMALALTLIMLLFLLAADRLFHGRQSRRPVRSPKHRRTP